MSAVRRSTLAAAISLLGLVVLCGLGAGPAGAAVTHHFLAEPSKRFGEDGLNRVNTMLVDSGQLYVGEGQYAGEGKTAPHVREFNAASGALTSQLASPPQWPRGLGVGRSTGKPLLYSLAIKGQEEGEYRSEVQVFNEAGNLLSTWTGADTPRKSFNDDESENNGLAVDESGSLSWAAGDVYVADEFNHVVDVFKPTAGGGEEYVTRLEGPAPPASDFASPKSVAVNDVNDEVLVVDSGTVDIFKPATLTGSYEFLGRLKSPAAGILGDAVGVTVDNGTGVGAGDIYVWEGQFGTDAVDEFGPAGEYLGRLTQAAAGPLKPVTSVAVDPATHDVYVGQPSVESESEVEPGSVAVFGPNVVIPNVATEAPSAVTPTGATLNGKVNSEGEGPASCEFVWGVSKAFGEVAKCPSTIEGEAAVHVTLSGLQPDTTYYYRLQAADKNGANPGESSPIEEFTTPGAGIAQETVTDVADTSVTLNATVNPHKAPTSYYFEYGKNAEYESQSPSSPGIPLGAGEGSVAVSRHLQGLTAGTVYHYRVVAVSEIEVQPGVRAAVVFVGPDRSFTTQSVGSSLTLPDGRQWELVSPPNKHGSQLIGLGDGEFGVAQASLNGSAITYLGWHPTEENPPGFPLYEQILSTRGPAGWSTQDISTGHRSAAELTAAEGPEYRFFSADLSLALAEPLGEYTPLAPEGSPPDTERTEYVRHNLTCQSAPANCYEPLLTGAPGYADVPAGTKFGGKEIHAGEVGGRRPAATFAVATPDLAHLVLGSSVALTSAPVGGGLYEWSAAAAPAEKLQLVTVLPDGEPSTEGGTTPTHLMHAVSSDGSRIFWSLPLREGGAHLYLRDLARGETIQLDAVQPGAAAGGSSASAVFQTASSDGSRVFFTDGQRLTATSGASYAGRDLYECVIVEVAGKLTCELSDLTPRNGRQSAVVEGVIGASEDGEWVYFAAAGVLAEHATPGAGNLYVRHGGVTALVAVVTGGESHDWTEDRPQLTARVSPNGQWLAFMSQLGLAGNDTRDAVSGVPDEEVYLYHAGANGGLGGVVCASCNPTGARPVGIEARKLLVTGAVGTDAGIWEGTWLAGSVPGWTGELHQPHYLSDEGRLFFDSSDALVPQDINGNEDVYEYEPAGVGSCSVSSVTFGEASGGCVSLISSGTSSAESGFVDASESGDDVFFLTDERLVPQDFDTATDMYDAHVCSAQVPCMTSVAASPACVTADACRAAPLPQPPIFGAPASATFSGAGNVTPSGVSPVVMSKSLTRAQKLARELTACRKRGTRKRRAACERQARKRAKASDSRNASRSSKRGVR